ncbi:MATE family efflux transporter [Rhabdobacter roseus]|uniref:Na+-driven multidrug efflux pump n=1 Tax=Rhabdobacter roseus TaxID=1655419 RepID=A0A840TNE5_9BACT|nr:MATE family efflux transporter [Rhabdobacter roseus]MBB5283072.1 Na+-driven multidrug efflux pump [Rhabdobacter roseus]
MRPPNELGKDPIGPLFFRFYGPILVSMLSITTHQLINGLVLGQYLGKEAVAALGLYAPLLLVVMALVLPLMIGSGILFSKRSGAGQHQSAQQLFQFATTLGLVASGLVAASAVFIARPLAAFLAGSENPLLLDYTTDYLFWSLLSLPLLVVRVLWGTFLNNDNAPHISKNASVLSSLLNIALDVLLVIIFPFGVAGAAIATGLSLLVALGYIYVSIRRRNGLLRFTHFQFSLRFGAWKELLGYGFPSFVSELCMALGFLLVNQSLLPYGSLAVATFGVLNFMNNIFLRLFTAAMIAAQPIMAFNLGAGSARRVLSTLRFALLFTMAVGVVVYAFGFFFPNLLLQMFTDNESEAFRQVASDAIRLSFLIYLVAGPNYLLALYLQIMGKVRLSVLYNALKGLGFVGLFLALVPVATNARLEGIWLARPLAELSTLLLLGLYTWYQKAHYYPTELPIPQPTLETTP